MFLQHHSQKSNSKDSLVIPSKDFELIIHSKAPQKITGIIQFQYLQNLFSTQIIITPNTIQIQGQQAFEDIQLYALVIPNVEVAASFYLQNGTLTQKGHQNIIWLILDFVHLYNLLRLKPGKVLELYRDAFSVAKLAEPNLVFGQLDINSTTAARVATILGQQWKRKLKYEFGNNLGLLASIQAILTNYPLQFRQNPISPLQELTLS